MLIEDSTFENFGLFNHLLDDMWNVTKPYLGNLYVIPIPQSNGFPLFYIYLYEKYVSGT